MGITKKIHEAVTMLTPTRNRTVVTYIGCREYVYNPLVTGSPAGVFAQSYITIHEAIKPIIVMGSPA